MDYTDFLLAKLIIAAVAAGVWGFYRGWHGLPLEPGEGERGEGRAGHT